MTDKYDDLIQQLRSPVYNENTLLLLHLKAADAIRELVAEREASDKQHLLDASRMKEWRYRAENDCASCFVDRKCMFRFAYVAGLERAAEITLKAQQDFLDPEYATDQPISSFAERFACGQILTAILSEKETTND